MKLLPYYVLSVLFLGNLVEGYLLSGQFTLYELMMAGVESSLGFILTLIFIQSLPLLTISKRRQSFKTEEIVCLIILLASVMTGTIGWTVYDLSIDHIFSRYLVLLFAFVAGATVGSTVGVVTGLIFSLSSVASFSHMSLLAFAGLLGGLLKEGKKGGVSIGLYIATLLMAMYGDGTRYFGHYYARNDSGGDSIISNAKKYNVEACQIYSGDGGVFTRTTTIYEKNARCYITKGRAVF